MCLQVDFEVPPEQKPALRKKLDTLFQVNPQGWQLPVAVTARLAQTTAFVHLTAVTDSHGLGESLSGSRWPWP